MSRNRRFGSNTTKRSRKKNSGKKSPRKGLRGKGDSVKIVGVDPGKPRLRIERVNSGSVGNNLNVAEEDSTWERLFTNDDGSMKDTPEMPEHLKTWLARSKLDENLYGVILTQYEDENPSSLAIKTNNGYYVQSLKGVIEQENEKIKRDEIKRNSGAIQNRYLELKAKKNLLEAKKNLGGNRRRSPTKKWPSKEPASRMWKDRPGDEAGVGKLRKSLGLGPSRNIQKKRVTPWD